MASIDEIALKKFEEFAKAYKYNTTRDSDGEYTKQSTRKAFIAFQCALRISELWVSGESVSDEHCSSSDRTLVLALRALARDVQCEDGIANAAILEASQRLEALSNAIENIRDAVLYERHQLAEAGLDCDQVNAVLGIIDDNDPRVLD